MGSWVVVLLVGTFAFMAFRAFRSGSAMDYALGGAQCLGLLAMLTPYRQFALYFLLMTSAAYLLSQVLTGARPLSRLLPLSGAALVLVTLFAVPG